MKHSRSILKVSALALLILSLTSCAKDSVAPTPVIHPAVQCQHPLVNPRSYQGALEGLQAYWKAVETCDGLNGFETQAVDKDE